LSGGSEPHHKKQEELIDARDRVSRWDVVEVQERATSLAAAHFLDTLINRMAFLIAALQVDGGSEFAADLNKSVSNEAYRSSCFRPVRPDSTVTSNAPIARTTRSSIR
jgi:hypothetical protein